MRSLSITARMLVAASLFLTVSGCDENNEEVIPEAIVEIPKPDADALKTYFDESITTRTQHFNVNASTGGNITGSKGTVIKFYTNAFLHANGDAVTGDVDVSLIEVYDRAAMIATRKATNGKNSDGKISIMKSAGEFYVNASQGGVELKSGGFQILAPTKNTGEIDQDMRQFNGVENCVADVCDVIWEEVNDRGLEIGKFQTAGGLETAYYVYQSKFGWTNIDRWYNDPRQKTTIFVDVPEGYNNTNCAVFIAYDGEPTALGRFDRYDEATGMFTEHYGLIPVGLKVHIILISIIEDEIHYAIQGATIAENHVEVVDEVTAITEAELVELIGKLP